MCMRVHVILLSCDSHTQIYMYIYIHVHVYIHVPSVEKHFVTSSSTMAFGGWEMYSMISLPWVHTTCMYWCTCTLHSMCVCVQAECWHSKACDPCTRRLPQLRCLRIRTRLPAETLAWRTWKTCCVAFLSQHRHLCSEHRDTRLLDTANFTRNYTSMYMHGQQFLTLSYIACTLTAKFNPFIYSTYMHAHITSKVVYTQQTTRH